MVKLLIGFSFTSQNRSVPRVKPEAVKMAENRVGGRGEIGQYRAYASFSDTLGSTR